MTAEYWVYILRCADGTLYTGSTRNLKQRLSDHNKGTGAKYTASRRPVKLVYSEPHRNQHFAMRREMQIKGWTRAKKVALIKGDVKLLKKLSRKRSQER
jgi:putative endonuclease